MANLSNSGRGKPLTSLFPVSPLGLNSLAISMYRQRADQGLPSPQGRIAGVVGDSDIDPPM